MTFLLLTVILLFCHFTVLESTVWQRPARSRLSRADSGRWHRLHHYSRKRPRQRDGLKEKDIMRPDCLEHEKYGFCERASEYPWLLANRTSRRFKGQDLKITSHASSVPKVPLSSAAKLPSMSSFQQACSTREHWIYPQLGKEDGTGKREFILNTRITKQAINVQLCSKPFHSCSHLPIPAAFALQLKTECRQLKATHRLIKANGETGEFRDGLSKEFCS